MSAYDATRYWPARWQRLRLRYQTLRDTSLVHQVQFQTIKGGSGGDITVTCNCRVTRIGTRGPNDHPPMGIVRNLDESRALYNDPANHFKPFDPIKDGARW